MACDLGKLTVNTTSKVLERAQPAIKQEADYELAAQAIPGTLKTVEGFWYVDKDNRRLTAILAEGYCQYATGFLEDAWELAGLERRLEDADALAARATKLFVRCMNYGLHLLGADWQERIFADLDTLKALLTKAESRDREGLLWTSIGLASSINLNKDNIALVAQLSTARMMLEKVIELDDKHGSRDMAKRALPHLAMGLIYTAQAPALGGDPKRADGHFRRAMELTDNKFLLAQVYYARRYAVTMQDRELFRKTLIQVLSTPPSVWPEQRLANEIAHRRAQRYLKYEKEWF